MKILIDDEKTHLPDGSIPDVIIRNYDAAKNLGYAIFAGADVYLDHDLGSEETGYTWISKLEEHLHIMDSNFGPEFHGWKPNSIICVSNNGAGRKRIEQVIQKLYGKLFY